MRSSRLHARSASPPWRSTTSSFDARSSRCRIVCTPASSSDALGARLMYQGYAFHGSRSNGAIPAFSSQNRLQLCTPVVVLDADESAPDPILRRRPRVSQDAEHPGFNTAVHRSHVRGPTASHFPKLIHIVVHGRDVGRVAGVPLLLPKLLHGHLLRHAPNVAALEAPFYFAERHALAIPLQHCSNADQQLSPISLQRLAHWAR